MALYRHNLPQLSDHLLLSDGGLETVLIFHKGLELPCNAAYVLLENDTGVETIRRYFDDYLDIARELRVGLVLESATWRANPDWAEKIGTSRERVAELNRKAIDILVEIRRRHDGDISPIVISGAVGPRADAYRPTEIMSEQEAEDYHSVQIRTFADTEADMATAFTLTNIPEAVGIARAAQSAGLPVAISFTVETDGRLPTGPSLKETVERVDEATNGAPAYYMINCAHPTHFEPALAAGEAWIERILGLRANSSAKSHAELDESPELDEGNPVELGSQYRALLEKLPHVRVLGGCCGTDHRHIREIGNACIGR